ncbi:cytochrome c heme lyase subunit CcmF [Klebsiella pneumoniae]|uniref:Cytochrome c heme lyase subunit CcmF n=1 Tax=Klebsiella pneumoniae TaxID=573 RepID=A0A3S4GP17_KLEPN|nr:cytochrome c heme lyase subunit CcmF [Klebsiella pneumoniae]
MAARVEHTLWSRESFLLGNNILLMAAMLVVLLGTLLPLVHKELGLGSISIGEPFFNTMFTALMAPFALLLGLGPLIRWRRDDVARQIKRLIIALLVTLSLSLALPWLLQDCITAMAVIGLMMALWVLIFALMEVHERATHRHGFWRGLRTLTRSQWGDGARSRRRGGDRYRHHLQPELQRGARCTDAPRRQHRYPPLSLCV